MTDGCANKGFADIRRRIQEMFCYFQRNSRRLMERLTFNLSTECYIKLKRWPLFWMLKWKWAAGIGPHCTWRCSAGCRARCGGRWRCWAGAAPSPSPGPGTGCSSNNIIFMTIAIYNLLSVWSASCHTFLTRAYLSTHSAGKLPVFVPSLFEIRLWIFSEDCRFQKGYLNIDEKLIEHAISIFDIIQSADAWRYPARGVNGSSRNSTTTRDGQNH